MGQPFISLKHRQLLIERAYLLTNKDAYYDSPNYDRIDIINDMLATWLDELANISNEEVEEYGDKPNG